MNCTKHILQRYAERFKKIEKQDINQNIIENKDLYEKELNKMISIGKMIYTGKFNEDNMITNYWLVDNIIIVTDTANTKMITLYRIEFGYGREIDKRIQQGLLEELDIAEEEYIKAMDEVKNEKDKLEIDKIQIKEKIVSLKEELTALESGLKGIENYINTINIKEVKTRVDRDIVAKKIVYSNIYKKAIEEYTMNY